MTTRSAAFSIADNLLRPHKDMFDSIHVKMDAVDALPEAEQREFIEMLVGLPGASWESSLIKSGNRCVHMILIAGSFRANFGAIQLLPDSNEDPDCYQVDFLLDRTVRSIRGRYLVGDTWTRDNLKLLKYALMLLPCDVEEAQVFLDSVEGLR